MNPTEMAMITIRNMMARTFFVDYWATEEEEAGRTYPGRNLFDVAPKETPRWAYRMVEDALAETAELSAEHDTKTVEEAWVGAIKLGAWEDTLAGAEDFGFKLAMQCMGSGVTLVDDLRVGDAFFLVNELETPFLESAVYALDLGWLRGESGMVTPRPNDSFSEEFLGTCIDVHDGLLTVIDMDGDAFDVDPDQFEVEGDL